MGLFKLLQMEVTKLLRLLMSLTLKTGYHLINFNQQLRDIIIFKSQYGGIPHQQHQVKIIFKLGKMVVRKLQFNNSHLRLLRDMVKKLISYYILTVLLIILRSQHTPQTQHLKIYMVRVLVLGLRLR